MLAYAGGFLLTAIYTALIVWIVGLAVPVTASYIICAVIAVPALIALKVPEFAAAAITGGDPYKTTPQCWKYTTPAFLVPFFFVLDPQGTGLLLTGSFKTLARADWGSIAAITFIAVASIFALVTGFQGWLFGRASAAVRALLMTGGCLLVYPEAGWRLTGFGLIAAAVAVQLLARRRAIA